MRDSISGSLVDGPSIEMMFLITTNLTNTLPISGSRTTACKCEKEYLKVIIAYRTNYCSRSFKLSSIIAAVCRDLITKDLEELRLVKTGYSSINLSRVTV